MEFCPACGMLLQIQPASSGHRLRLFCPTCPYVCPIKNKIVKKARLAKREVESTESAPKAEAQPNESAPKADGEAKQPTPKTEGSLEYLFCQTIVLISMMNVGTESLGSLSST